jgi:hypothetical protein
MIDIYSYLDALSEELYIWANLDGCEGGDFLNSLGAAIGTAHYSYVDDEEVPRKLIRIALEEIDIHSDYQTPGETHQNWGYVEQCFDNIKEIWKDAYR